MPTSFRIKDLDQMFRESKIEPVIINDLPYRTEEDRDAFSRLVESRFSSDIVSIRPTCRCGQLVGEHRLGQTCPSCGFVVSRVIETDLVPRLWFRRPGPKGKPVVEKLINPMIWIFLDQRLTKGQFKLLNWLTDRNYRCPGKMPPWVDELKEAGIERGYNFFVRNFWEITRYLLSRPEFKAKGGMQSPVYGISEMLGMPTGANDPLIEVLERYRDVIFVDHIPIINKSLVILEPSSTALYGDQSVPDIKDALNTMVSIDVDFYDKSVAAVENRTGKILAMLTAYYRTIFKTNYNPKEGIPRRHLGATRTNKSFRTVMTSHDGVQSYDEIWMPWCVGIVTMGMELTKYLMDRKEPYGGLTHNEAIGFLTEHIYQYHPMLDEMLQRLIAETRDGWLSVLIQRNESGCYA